MAIVNFDSNNSNSDNRKYLFSRFFAANQKNAFSKLKKVCLGQNKRTHTQNNVLKKSKKEQKTHTRRREEEKKEEKEEEKKRKKCGVKTFLLGHWHSQQ